MSGRYKSARRGGYEVSSVGDRRFSAMYARLGDGRTIEEHYQCDVKGYDPGGVNWRLGKGKPPLDPSIDLWQAYLGLWLQWAKGNEDLLSRLGRYLDENEAKYALTLSDCFAKTPINQAAALAWLLNNQEAWKTGICQKE